MKRALVLVLIACSRPAQPQQGPVPVEVRRATERAVPESSEYIASLTSRHAVDLHPQVSGVVRAIRARPGDRVHEGAPLVEIDPGQLAGQVAAARATLLTRRAALDFAAKNDESSRRLVDAGVLSRLDYEQRHSQYVAARADVAAARAQVEGLEAQIAFYEVRAPTDGVVGDVPVKVGAYVSPDTRLTSVQQDRRIEAYVYVPRGEISRLGPSTRLELLSSDGHVLCDERPSFVAPGVDPDTQTVLVKSLCPNQGELKTEEVLSARVVWRTRSAITVPIAATVRQSGQYFVFVVERAPRGDVARQKAVTVGPILENAYVIERGLSPGEMVITSNVQKIREGAPIAAPHG